MQILLNILIAYGVISIIFTTIFLIGLVRNIRKELNIVNGAKEAAEKLKIVYVEHDDSMYRMYDKTNNNFICQAKDELELWNLAKSRFQDKNIITLSDDKKSRRV